MGSDFNYSDMTSRNLGDYDFTLQKEMPLGDHTVWVIEAIPRSDEVIDVLEALKMENQMDGPTVALVDIPDNGGFYIMKNSEEDITVEMLEKFLESPGERQQMS